jgi:hypothetical protein
LRTTSLNRRRRRTSTVFLQSLGFLPSRAFAIHSRFVATEDGVPHARTVWIVGLS